MPAPLVNPDNSCAFTGHRPSKLPWGFREDDPRCLALKDRLYDVVSALYGGGIRHFLCGMALGCDQYFAEAVLALQEEHPDITLEAAVPCETQALHWSAEQRARYDRLVARCDDVTLISRDYTPTCMRDRNRYMVDRAAVLVAVYDGSRGGTQQTVDYARKLDREILLLRPAR